jgi:hypothetical protein
MAVKFMLTAFDPESDEFVNRWDLPGIVEADIDVMFELRPGEESGSHIVRASQKSDLEKVSGQEIDLNLYDYFVEDYEDDPLTQARTIISDLIEAADYLRKGGVLDSLSHGPDGGKKWHDALAAAEDFLDDGEDDDEEEGG